MTFTRGSLPLAVALSFAAVSLAARRERPRRRSHGVVVDSGGGVIPGATVIVKNDGTGAKFETVSNTDGHRSRFRRSPPAPTR